MPRVNGIVVMFGDGRIESASDRGGSRQLSDSAGPTLPGRGRSPWPGLGRCDTPELPPAFLLASPGRFPADNALERPEPPRRWNHSDSGGAVEPRQENRALP